MSITLHDVLYVPHLWINILSIIKALKNPHMSLGSINGLITIIIINKEIIFSKVFENGSGRLLGLDIIQSSEAAHTAQIATFYMDVHNSLGHPNEQVTMNTAHQLYLKIAWPDNPCICCAICNIKTYSIYENS